MKSSQRLHFFFGNHKDSKPNGIIRHYTPGDLSYTGYFKDLKPNGIGRINCPSGFSYIGEWKNGDMNWMGI